MRNTCGELPAVFTLSKLSELYAEQIRQHGGILMNTIYPTRLKECLLNSFQDLVAVNYGRDVFLTFDDDISNVLNKVKYSHDANAVHLMHTAKLIRSEMFSNTYIFNGASDKTCQSISLREAYLLW